MTQNTPPGYVRTTLAEMNKTVGFQSWNGQQYPDMNPIGLVWDEVDRRVKAKQPTNATHLHF